MTLHLLGLFVFKSTLTTVECKGAENTGKVTNSGTKTENAQGKVEKASWSECSSVCGAATVTPLNLPWTFEAVSTESEVIKGAGGEVTTCGLTCKYEAAEAKTNFSGGEKASITMSEVPLKRVGGSLLCPATATWGVTLDLLPEHYGYSVLI